MTYKEIKDTYKTIESIDNRLSEIESIERSLKSETQQLNLLRNNIFKEDEMSKYNKEVDKANKEWIVIINKEHPIANNKRRFVSLEELSNEELLVPTQRINEVSGWFSSRKLASNIVCGFSPLMNAIVMAEKNLGIAVLPESCKKMLISDRLIVKELSENMVSTVSFIWKKQYELPGTAKRFLDFVKNNPIDPFFE